MRVLIACEFSGIVRDAFIARGNDAISCDLLPSERPGPHWQGDVREIMDNNWDLIIAHPPCTYLASSGARWWKDRQDERQEAIEFFMLFVMTYAPRIAIENPIGIMSTYWRKPDQIIQPWQFGHGETKATCLWLKGLSKLQPTKIVDGRADRIHRMPETKNRWRERSRTYQGIADAMAEQWS
jgi:hypothetical protein